jgi:hypothetical protein
MAEQIIDGKGNGFRAQVDSDNRLHVNSVTRTQVEQAVLLSEGYNVSTGSMTLTSANESAVGYFKYNGDDPIVIKEILVILGASTGGSGTGLIKIIKNPTSGTIITEAKPVSTASNRDFGSSKVLDSDAYKGEEADTLTDGDVFAVTSRDAGFSGVVSFDAAPIVLRKGNSIGITFEPATGNNSQSIVIAGTLFIETATVSGDL